MENPNLYKDWELKDLREDNAKKKERIILMGEILIEKEKELSNIKAVLRKLLQQISEYISPEFEAEIKELIKN